MAFTLQDLKNLIAEVEQELPEGMTADEIYFQEDYAENISNIEINQYNYSDFIYLGIKVNK